MIRRVIGVTAAFLCASAALLPIGASAHSELRVSRPGQGETVGGTIDVIELEFFTRILPEGLAISLLDPSGAEVSPVGDPTLDERGLIARQSFTPITDPGAYTVEYAVTSVDGDDVPARFEFTYEPSAPGPTANLSEPGSDDGGGSAGVVVIVLVSAAVLAALAAAHQFRRR